MPIFTVTVAPSMFDSDRETGFVEVITAPTTGTHFTRNAGFGWPLRPRVERNANTTPPFAIMVAVGVNVLVYVRLPPGAPLISSEQLLKLLGMLCVGSGGVTFVSPQAWIAKYCHAAGVSDRRKTTVWGVWAAKRNSVSINVVVAPMTPGAFHTDGFGAVWEKIRCAGKSAPARTSISRNARAEKRESPALPERNRGGVSCGFSLRPRSFISLAPALRSNPGRGSSIIPSRPYGEKDYPRPTG